MAETLYSVKTTQDAAPITTATAAQLNVLVGGGQTSLHSHAGGGGESENVVVLTVDRTNATTSFADITGLTFTPLANKTYIIEAWLIFRSDTAGTGIGFAGNGPASPVAYVMNVHIPIALTLYASDSMMASRAYDVGTPSVSVDTINLNLLAKIDCVLVNGANSTPFTLRFKAEATGTVKVLAGSVCRYRQVN